MSYLGTPKARSPAPISRAPATSRRPRTAACSSTKWEISGKETQGKFLRLLEEREYVRVGDTEPRRSDARIIAATHRDLKAVGSETVPFETISSTA